MNFRKSFKQIIQNSQMRASIYLLCAAITMEIIAIKEKNLLCLLLRALGLIKEEKLAIRL